MPDDRNIVIERVRDELGDWRVCVLTPFGSRVHAPWAMAATAKIACGVRHRCRRRCGARMDLCCGFRRRDEPPVEPLLLEPEKQQELVLRQLGSDGTVRGEVSRERGAGSAAAEARPDGRTPLWQQRKRAV